MFECHACESFIPDTLEHCPACGAAPPKPLAVRAAHAVGRTAALATTMVTLMACYGAGFYGEYVECEEDLDCGPGGFCSPESTCLFPESCGDGFDNDLDGDVDAFDADCDFVELNCTDLEDDDEDGDTDCADLDCAANPSCQEVCGDGLDNDKDGATDCADLDCGPCPGVETVCDDVADDDGDGATNCADPDCATHPSCAETSCGDGLVAPNETCDDANEDPTDGCDACSADSAVLCAAFPELVLGANEGLTGSGTNLLAAACALETGSETVFRFTPSGPGTLYLTVDSDADLSLWAFVPTDPTLGCVSSSSLVLGCVDASGPSTTETTAVQVFADYAPMFVVVDSVGPVPSVPFTLEASFVATP
jgi:cysteine-rich repeat protein